MLPLNVSFGIFAFLPMGWLFMAFVIFGEAFLMCKYLIQKKFDARIYKSAAVSNIVSGVIGIIISMALSYAFAAVPLFDGISSGIKVIILTVVISAAAAYFFPVKEDRDAA